MSSTFFGLTISSSGLNTYQAALNTTANNISNVQTKGYTRQEASMQSSEALRIHAKYGSQGSGVEVTEIKQIRETFYDKKYWENTKKLGENETKFYYLDQIQTFFKDDSTVKGFNSILDNFFSSLDSVKDSATDLSVRANFVGEAKTFTDYFNQMYSSLQSLQSDINEELYNKVSNINAIAQKLASMTKQINVVELSGGAALELRDQRNLMLDELSSLVPIDVEEIEVTDPYNENHKTGATLFRVKVNGSLLVNTYDFNTLTCEARENKINESDADGLYDVFWTATGNTLNLNSKAMGGEIKALYDLRDGNNASYFSGMIKDIEKDKMTITCNSFDEIQKNTVSHNGALTIDGKEYKYLDYTVEENEDGSLNYEFTMEDNLGYLSGDLAGHKAQVGTEVNYYGIPYYLGQMNEYVRTFAKLFNDIHLEGVNLDAEDAESFFTVKNSDKTPEIKELGNYLSMNAGNISINTDILNDARKLATISKEKYNTLTDAVENGTDNYDLAEKLLNLKNGVIMFRGGTAADYLQCVLSDVSIDANGAYTFAKQYDNIVNTITNSRLSISGVDEDEEALSLVKYQMAYNLSSKMVSVFTEIYDRLILQTGV